MKLILPSPFLLGFWGSAPFPWLLILSYEHRNNTALIAHEQCHQEQQRRDGVLTFWWRYLTSPAHRLAYELEAYRVWLQVAPQDEARVVYWLTSKYGLDVTHQDALALLQASS